MQLKILRKKRKSKSIWYTWWNNQSIHLVNHREEEYNKYAKKMMEKESSKSLKSLRLDKGGEFTSDDFTKYCKFNAIKRYVSSLRTP